MKKQCRKCKSLIALILILVLSFTSNSFQASACFQKLMEPAFLEMAVPAGEAKIFTWVEGKESICTTPSGVNKIRIDFLVETNCPDYSVCVYCNGKLDNQMRWIDMSPTPTVMSTIVRKGNTYAFVVKNNSSFNQTFEGGLLVSSDFPDDDSDCEQMPVPVCENKPTGTIQLDIDIDALVSKKMWHITMTYIVPIVGGVVTLSSLVFTFIKCRKKVFPLIKACMNPRNQPGPAATDVNAIELQEI